MHQILGYLVYKGQEQSLSVPSIHCRPPQIKIAPRETLCFVELIHFLIECKTMVTIVHSIAKIEQLPGAFSLPAQAENMNWNLSAHYNEARGTMSGSINCRVIKYQCRHTTVLKHPSFKVMQGWIMGALSCVLQLYQDTALFFISPSTLPYIGFVYLKGDFWLFRPLMHSGSNSFFTDLWIAGRHCLHLTNQCKQPVLWTLSTILQLGTNILDPELL